MYRMDEGRHVPNAIGTLNRRPKESRVRYGWYKHHTGKHEYSTRSMVYLSYEPYGLGNPVMYGTGTPWTEKLRDVGYHMPKARYVRKTV